MSVTQFEYDIPFFKIMKQKNDDETRHGLNERGANGWEVITTVTGDHGCMPSLKREGSPMLTEASE